MRTTLRIAVAASVALSLALAMMGCETSHSSSDRDTLLGGHKHEETTVTKNPITGETSVEHSEQTTH